MDMYVLIKKNHENKLNCYIGFNDFSYHILVLINGKVIDIFVDSIK